MNIAALQVIGTLAAVVYLAELWSGHTSRLWLAFVLMFLAPEIIGVTRGGTFSGWEGRLRDSGVLIRSLLGAAILTVTGWTVWHFWWEPDLFPRLRQTYLDDGLIMAAIFLGSILTRALRRKQ